MGSWALKGKPAQKGNTGKSHRYPLAGNLIPHIDVAKPEWEWGGYTKEEMKCKWEINKILFRMDINSDKIPISATCVRVSIRRCHSMVLNIEYAYSRNPVVIRRKLQADPQKVVLLDNLANYVYPMPLNMEGREEVGVGRIRYTHPGNPLGLTMWVCGDQLLRGVALIAVEIAENIF
ncbi:MAG TPA: hypothetical protein ENN28_02130 [Candidatus Uhrbacteria bacterium]|nr:hypothetical protein [Candidatus Uhrbacteria bacterium]